ncbi:transport SSO2 [Lecanosticta acicola]|uniref:Transport SSO2 n=1 Tax=Lecanosticta acicola TaxID=111012 RepID=A0AAI9E8T8_9PEZI|nr:transport SSO2 [Lecanosticta acicola]
MSDRQYNQYNTGYAGGYGGGYGQSNPYDNRDGSYEHPPPSYGQNVEMQPLTNNGAPYAPTPEPRDPNAILNDCRAVGRAIDDLEGRLNELQRLQKNFTSGSGASNKDVDSLSADIMSGYRGLADRVKRIKSQPDARSPRNQAQVDALDRRIRKAINQYQQVESQFRKEVQEQQRRQYLIVNPNATEQEIREVTEAGGDTQIFQQALLNADRRGQAQSTLANVKQRHQAIQQIERTMIELQQLFQDLDAMVVQQEEPVMAIEQKAEETHTHLEAGNVHVGKAVDSARAARKKKWICLGIVVAIIIAIVLIVVIYLAATGRLSSGNKNSNNNANNNQNTNNGQ